MAAGANTILRLISNREKQTSIIAMNGIYQLGVSGVLMAATFVPLGWWELARLATIGMVVLQYVLVLYLVLSGYLSFMMLVVLFAVPSAWRAIQVYLHPRPAAPPPEYPPNIWPLWYAALSFSHTRRFGMLFLLGLILDVIARGVGLVG